MSQYAVDQLQRRAVVAALEADLESADPGSLGDLGVTAVYESNKPGGTGIQTPPKIPYINVGLRSAGYNWFTDSSNKTITEETIVYFSAPSEDRGLQMRARARQLLEGLKPAIAGVTARTPGLQPIRGGHSPNPERQFLAQGQVVELILHLTCTYSIPKE